VFALLEAPIQLVPDGTLLFHLLCIVVMVTVLNATLLKPINRILEERQKRTSGRLTEAQRTALETEAKWREYERRLREARAEGYSLMERERAGLSRDREQRVGVVKAEIAEWLSQEKVRLKADEEHVKERLTVDARDAAQAISSKILRRSVS
jgi:F-type H+-transporting ATPase subunit b